MRFLIDNALSPEVATRLRNVGHDAVHVRDCGLQAAEDEAILKRAASEGRVIVSADSDFGMLLAVHRLGGPSFILFREASVIRAEDYATQILKNLRLLERELNLGCVVTFRRGRTRIRSLPFAGPRGKQPSARSVMVATSRERGRAVHGSAGSKDVEGQTDHGC